MTFVLEDLCKDLLFLCLFPKAALLFRALTCIYKARRNLGKFKEQECGNFWVFFTDPNIHVCTVDWAKPGEHKFLLTSEQKCQFLLCTRLQNSIMSHYTDVFLTLSMFKTSCSN